LLNNRSIYSLIAHSVATIAGLWFATVFFTKGGSLFASGSDLASSDAGIFSLILWVFAAIVFIVALVPFLGLILGWIAFFIRRPVLTLISAIAYLLLTLFSIGDSEGELSGAIVLSLIGGILGIMGFVDERRIRSRG
jgi:hypothetical protein